MVVIKNGRGFFGHGTLKSALSKKWIGQMSWFFPYWYIFRNVNSSFDDYWVGMVKNGSGLIDHRTLKSGAYQKWFGELCRLIE